MHLCVSACIYVEYRNVGIRRGRAPVMRTTKGSEGEEGYMIFPQTSLFFLTMEARQNIQNDYTGHGVLREGNFLPRHCPRPHRHRCRRRKKVASPLRFLFDPRVILLFSRTIKFPVMARFRLNEETNSPCEQAKNGLLECRKGRARA